MMQILLVVIVALVSITVADDDCPFPAACKKVAINNAEFDAYQSPFYDQVVTSGYDHDFTDNVCSTFIPFGEDVYVWCRYVTYVNGTSVLFRYIITGVQEYTGIYRAQGNKNASACDTCVFNDYILGQPCSNAYVLYRCFLFGDTCTTSYQGLDIRYGFSSSETVSEECYRSILSLGFVGDLVGAPVRLPNKLNKQCVVSINNVPAINYERVPCAYRVYL